MFDPFLTEKQILRKLGGDKKTGKVITFDGNLSGKEALEIEPGAFFVKLSDDVYDLNNTERITIFHFDGEKTFQKDAFTIGYDGPMCSILLNERPYVLVISEDIPESLSKGLWITHMTDNGFFVYPSKIQIAGTIVPIDQKHLPGVCLPVVELRTEFTDVGASLTSEECVNLDNVAAIGLPIVVKFCIEGNAYSGVFALTAEADRYMFSFSMNGITFVLQNNGVSWDAFVYAMG